MTTATPTAREIITRALDEASDAGRPLWRHHECYEPELRAMASSGECVYFGSYYDSSGVRLTERCDRGYYDIELVGWWRRPALIARLERAARQAEHNGRSFGRVEEEARHAADLRAFAATL